MSIAVDCGTYNLVACTRDENNGFKKKREVNAFVQLSLEDNFLFNIMRSKNVPILEEKRKDGQKSKVGYLLGESAISMALALNQIELKRPMRSGCVNPKESNAFEILKVMIHSLLEGMVKHDKEILYYTIPAEALNEKTNVEYHSKILELIFKAFESSEGYKVTPNPINEGLALVYAELEAKNYTGFSASFGSGMVNVCFALFGVPVFSFALVNSGDWIDETCADATGESIAFINRAKTEISLVNSPTNLIERAIQTQYKTMIEKTVAGIKKGLENSSKKARVDQDVDFVIAGGTSMPEGFDTLFKEIIMKTELPIKIGNIVRPPDPLYSVSRGALLAAEAASR
jgi:actin-related protein